MKNLLIFTFVLSLFLISSCTQENLRSEASVSLENLTIKSGQSFGFCVGKCYSEIAIKGKKVTLLVKETSSKGNSNIKNEYTFTDELTDAQVSAISSAFDLTKINAKPDVIGCPDCADGGAEWIAIEQGESVKKVTFEYGKDVPELEKLVNLLRNERNALLKKFVKE
jgi:hypothetical protein